MWGFMAGEVTQAPMSTYTSSRSATSQLLLGAVPVKAASLLSQANRSQLGHWDGGKKRWVRKGRKRVRRVGVRHRELSPTEAVHVQHQCGPSAVRCTDQGRLDRCWGFFSCLHALKHSQTAWKHKQDVILSPLQGRIQDIVPTEAQWGCFKACTQLCPIYWCSQSHCGGQAA